MAFSHSTKNGLRISIPDHLMLMLKALEMIQLICMYLTLFPAIAYSSKPLVRHSGSEAIMLPLLILNRAFDKLHKININDQ